MRIAPRRVARATAALALALGAATAAPASPDVAERALAGMTVSLTREQPYRFVLAYHGPNLEFRGEICYGFAGYNETCLRPSLDWLTAASEIELYAPGGVPRDLLDGYVLLVRFPALSDQTFRYRLPDAG